MVTFVRTKIGLQVYNKEGQVFSVTTDHPFFNAIASLVLDADKSFEDFLVLFEAKKPDNLMKLALGDNVEIKKVDGVLSVTYKGIDLPPSLQKRLVTSLGKIMGASSFENMIEMELSQEADPVINFIENLMKNPSRGSVADLYGFLEACSLPITSDGYFLAYKKVRYDFKDIYSGKHDNSVGKELEMERWEVDDNRQQTCSTGYHCCSFEYLSHYGGISKDSHRVLVVKVNPKDVVSVPVDYNNQKMRVCKYKVIDEIPGASQGKITPWFISPALEGKMLQLTEGIISAIREVGTEMKMNDIVILANEGINFGDPLILPIIAEKKILELVKKFLVEELEVNVDLVDTDEFIEEFGAITVNSLIDYISERVM